jgi:hypothetical protein
MHPDGLLRYPDGCKLEQKLLDTVEGADGKDASSGRMMLVCLASGRDEHVVRTDGTLYRWASGRDDTSSERLTGNLKSSIFFVMQSLLKML